MGAIFKKIRKKGEMPMTSIMPLINLPEFKDWIIGFLVFLILLYIFFPKVKDFFYKMKYGQDLVDEVKDLKTIVKGPGGVLEKLDRDYTSINYLKDKQKVDAEESELVMQALLAILRGIPRSAETETAEKMIINFMNKQSHK